MNFKINNINFGAQYYVYGKQTPQKTMKAYDNEIATKEYRLKTAVQGQEYMETPLVQDYLDWIPEDTFVRLHTGVLDGEGKRKDEFLDFFEIMVKNTGNRIFYFQRMTEKFLIIDYAQQPVKIRNIIIFLLVNTICGDILGVLR